MNDTRFQALLKRSWQNFLSCFIISQDSYELSKRTISANRNIYHIFKPNHSRVVQIFYQDKASLDMTLLEFKILTSTCWDEKYQPLIFDKTKDKHIGRYRLGLKSLFVPDRSLFWII